MVQSYSEGSLNHFSKPFIFFSFGAILALGISEAEKNRVVLQTCFCALGLWGKKQWVWIWVYWDPWDLAGVHGLRKKTVGCSMGGLQGHRVQPLVFPYLVAFSVLNDTTFPFQLFFLFFFSFASWCLATTSVLCTAAATQRELLGFAEGRWLSGLSWGCCYGRTLPTEEDRL